MRDSDDLPTTLGPVCSAFPTALVGLCELVDWFMSAKLLSDPGSSSAAEAQNRLNLQIVDHGLVDRPAPSEQVSLL